MTEDALVLAICEHFDCRPSVARQVLTWLKTSIDPEGYEFKPKFEYQAFPNGVGGLRGIDEDGVSRPVDAVIK